MYVCMYVCMYLVEDNRMGMGMGAGTETRVLAEVGTGTRMGTGTETMTRSVRDEVRRSCARNLTNVADAIRHFPSARVIISADRGWRLRAPDSCVRKARYLYTHIAPRG